VGDVGVVVLIQEEPLSPLDENRDGGAPVGFRLPVPGDIGPDGGGKLSMEMPDEPARVR
jgi:hypothetical protein